MSETTKAAVEYIKQLKCSLLITVGEQKVPYARVIGPFAADGLDIYFATSPDTQKVRHIAVHPTVTLYFQNEGQSYKTFKSVSISGTMSLVTDPIESGKAVEMISQRSSSMGEWIRKKELAICKVNAGLLRYTDNTKSPNIIEERM